MSQPLLSEPEEDVCLNTTYEIEGAGYDDSYYDEELLHQRLAAEAALAGYRFWR